MAPKLRGKVCSAVKCSNDASMGISLFRFPVDKARCRVWVQNCRREDIRKISPLRLNYSFRLCADHFERSQFMNEDKNKLVWNAVPTLFDVPNPPPTIAIKRPPPKERILQPYSKRKRATRMNKDHEHSVRHSADEGNNLESSCQPLPKSLDKVGERSLSAACEVQNNFGKIPALAFLCHLLNVADSMVSDKNDGQESSHQTTTNVQYYILERPLTGECATQTDFCNDSDTLKKVKFNNSMLSMPLTMSQPQMGSKSINKKCINKIIAAAKKYMNSVQLEFLKLQLAMSDSHGKDIRWSYKSKVCAMTLYTCCQKTYGMLSKILHLPSELSLCRWINAIDLQPGLSQMIFDVLSVKVKHFTEQQRKCVIAFNEMSIKSEVTWDSVHGKVEGLQDYGNETMCELSNQALVFMCRGLQVKWNQVLGYFLTTDTVDTSRLKDALLNCVSMLNNIGFEVVAVVCDVASTNCELYKELGIKVSHPYFECRGRKVFAFHDPPNLLKCTRNMLKSADIEIEDHSISWKHIVNFVEQDSSQAISLAPEIKKNNHISLPGFSSMKVSLAAQVLSHSVAAGVHMYCSFGILPPEAVDTAEFVEKMDTLFDTFNSRSMKDEKPFRCAIGPATAHMQNLAELFKWLESWKITSKCQSPSVYGWLLSIKALMGLWSQLQECGFQFLLTSRISHDPLDKLFCRIRKSECGKECPNAQEFRFALKKVVAQQLLTPCPGSMCELDLDVIMDTLKDIQNRRKSFCKGAFIESGICHAPCTLNETLGTTVFQV